MKSLLYVFLLIITSSINLVSEDFFLILGRPTKNSITINAIHYLNNDQELLLEYGLNSTEYDKSTLSFIVKNDEPAVIELKNLLPNRQYYYRIKYKSLNTNDNFKFGEEHFFNTQKDKGSSFTFVIQADPHLYDKKGSSNMIIETMKLMQKDRPDLLFDLGDTFGDDHNPFTITDEELKYLHSDYLKYFDMVCNSSSLFLCLGNHEGESGYYLLQNPPKNIATYATKWRKYYYSNPEPNDFYSGNTNVEENGIGLPQNYYAFEWGDALFVVLDVYRYYTINEKPKGWDWTIGDDQYFWFKNTLETSKSKYKFVFAHHVLGQGRGAVNDAILYEWGGWNNSKKTNYEFPSKRPTWTKPIHQLMVDNGVNIFFQGHDHLFAQEELDGLIYQECPMPSDSTYEIGMLANADAYISNQLNGTGYIRVTVNSESSKVEYIRSYLPADTNTTKKNGEVAFTYEVQPKITSISNDLITNQISSSQNYPNPFVNETTIGYFLEQSSNVNIEIYDIFGRKITTLIDKFQYEGHYNISINFNDFSNIYGIYYYKFKANNKTEFKTMIYSK